MRPTVGRPGRRPPRRRTARKEPRRAYWNRIYRHRGEDELSWHQEEPRLSLALLRKFAPPPRRIVDIGGGSSLLAGRLVERGYPAVTVVDVSDAAIRRGQLRNGRAARAVRWVRGDITRLATLGPSDVWHDRAVLHFLIARSDRARYRALLDRTVADRGWVILSTFAPDGPLQCSGLPVERYDARKLADWLGEGFVLRRSVAEVHATPWGTHQAFTYAVLQRRKAPAVSLAYRPAGSRPSPAPMGRRRAAPAFTPRSRAGGRAASRRSRSSTAPEARSTR